VQERIGEAHPCAAVGEAERVGVGCERRHQRRCGGRAAYHCPDALGVDHIPGVQVGVEGDVRYLAAIHRLAAARRLARQARADHTGALLPGWLPEEDGDAPAAAAVPRAVPTPYGLVEGTGVERRAADAGGVRLIGRIVDCQVVESLAMTVRRAVVT